MKRLLLLVAVLLVPMTAFAAAPDERCSARVDLTGLPLLELTTKKPSDRFAIMISGDGGWRRIDTKVTDRLRNAGIPVVGFLANDYFAQRRTAEESSCALERVIRAYKLRWKKEKVMLVGYSRGADVLPFMITRLPHDLRASVEVVALLGLEPLIEFKYNSPWTSARFRKEPLYAVKPEVEKLRGMNVICVYGEKEKDSLCHMLDPKIFTILREPGGHHFGGKYHDIGEAIIAIVKPPS